MRLSSAYPSREVTIPRFVRFSPGKALSGNVQCAPAKWRAVLLDPRKNSASRGTRWALRLTRLHRGPEDLTGAGDSKWPLQKPLWHAIELGMPRRQNDSAASAPKNAAVTPPTKEQISLLMAQLGRKGGKKGGKRRLETMTPERRSAAARKAAEARWNRNA